MSAPEVQVGVGVGGVLMQGSVILLKILHTLKKHKEITFITPIYSVCKVLQLLKINKNSQMV